ncbi:isoprenyl transferase [Mesohalobacter halotolerans]|uniref:Isoprenyl transferase n=1 Tax=Mesohalobacter halotolerans TaxID=1883405 RepID=A0A4U5TNS9_9FLAO|nr:isoprenyl transferase [Mesohalobacter halotolerans]MBS3737632.1 isoprenyl transferase [Psychroflexus sp.]NBC58364.1 isoprenyl transferase [Bacteroidota bacterium]TKS55462.1 isoprenyl transferase [Mesohalobacter halotolerans]
MTKPALDKSNIPKHIAIIMDGNGRWAKNKGFKRVIGHEHGTSTVNKIVEACVELGVEYLTLFAFSTENWQRPKYEINSLMKLLLSSLRKELDNMHDKKIKLTSIGNTSKLPDKVKSQLEEVKDATKDYDRLNLTLALSYSAREEIVNAVKTISQKVKNNLIDINNIDDSTINTHLYTNYLPDVDLLIRTSGEQRISNFMLWQIAYAELYFCKELWPDFTKEHLFEAINNFQKRERRFGKTSEQLK